jgi:hypothetical protein
LALGNELSTVIALDIIVGSKSVVVNYYHRRFVILSSCDNGKVTAGSKFEPALLIL